MGDLHDDLAFGAAGQHVVDEPPHQRTLRRDDDSVPGELLLTHRVSRAERVGVRVHDQH